MFNQFSTKTKQHGAVLVTTLVFLMILTLFGVTSARDAKTQLLIAGNNQVQTVSLATAEGALTRVENTVACLRGLVADGSGLVVGDGTGLEEGDAIVIDHASLNGSICYEQSGSTGRDSNFLSEKDFTENVITVTLIELTEICPETAASESAQEIFKITVKNDQSRGAKRKVQSIFQALSKQLVCT